MLSRNGKYQYICPHCHNPDIKQIHMYGQKSIECRKCNRWFAWSMKKEIPVGEKRMLREDYMFTVGIGIGMLLAMLFMVVIFNFTQTRFEALMWSGAIVLVFAGVMLTWVNLKFRGIV